MTDPKSQLDGFFDAARAQPPVPSSDLMARVHGDAQLQIQRHTNAAQAGPTLYQRFVSFWPVWSGTVPAALVGLWIGINPPSGLPDPVLWLDTSLDETSDLSSDFDEWTWIFEEEGQL